MYNRLYNFLEMNSVIYDLQFGYRQKYSTCHALIHLTDKIREHDILIQKLNQYGIRGVVIGFLHIFRINLRNMLA